MQHDVRTGPASGASGDSRKLDILIPTYNRPAKLYQALRSGLDLNIPGTYFVVIDDGSSVVEEISGLGRLGTDEVVAKFASDRIISIRNPENLGLAMSLERYYSDFCSARYTLLINDKDEFINSAPISSAIAKLDSDPALSAVLIPLRQVDRVENDRPLPFRYPRMTGREFLEQYVADSMLQHAGMYGIMRVSAVRQAGVPRCLNLRRFGLEDAFGIDIDFLLTVATTGDFDFESEAHVRRSVVGGATERFPLTFAYTYYQYAQRVMGELLARGFITQDTLRRYVAFWLLLIARGVIVAFRPVHGSEQEPGTKRIAKHLRLPILLYLPLQCLKFRIAPGHELIGTYLRAVRVILEDRCKRAVTSVTGHKR